MCLCNQRMRIAERTDTRVTQGPCGKDIEIQDEQYCPEETGILPDMLPCAQAECAPCR